MAKRLEEILPVKFDRKSDGGKLFEEVVGYNSEAVNGGIAMSSGCVSCNNGGGSGGKGGIRYEENNYEKKVSKN